MQNLEGTSFKRYHEDSLQLAARSTQTDQVFPVATQNPIAKVNLTSALLEHDRNVDSSMHVASCKFFRSPVAAAPTGCRIRIVIQ